MPTDPAHRKLLFHIGHHKTGSTSIQNAFATGRVKLVGGHILYPGRLNHNYLRRHFEIYAREGRVLPGGPAFPGLATISEQLGRGGYDVAVISGEEFEEASPQVTKKVLQEFMLPHVTEYLVIGYIRPHAARLLSNFAEQMKIGIVGGTPDAFFDNTLASGRFFYAPRMAEWANAFGAHLRLNPLIRSELSGGDVLRDFIATGLGPNTPVEIAPVPTANESLTVEDLLVVKLVQDRLQARGPNLRLEIGWELAEAFGKAARMGAPGTRLMLHKSLAERIRTTYRADAEAMDARFFGSRNLLRDELDRAVDEALPAAQSLDPATYFSADALRAISVLATQVSRLFENKDQPWPDFLLQRRMAALHGQTKSQPARKPE